MGRLVGTAWVALAAASWPWVNNVVVVAGSGEEACSLLPLASGGRLKPFVDGSKVFVGSAIENWTGEVTEVSSPIFDEATGKRAVIGRLSALDAEAAVLAVRAAADAWALGQGTWPQLSLKSRIEAMERYLEALQGARAEIIETLMWEIAKTTKDAAIEFDRTIDFAREVLENARNLDSVEPMGRWTELEGVRARVRRGPVGVTLMLAPFNYPLNEMYAMMIPALVMGNCIVLKLPAIGALAHVLTMPALAASLPPGVVNFVSGSGRVTLPAVMESGLVDCLGFIGGSRGADALIKSHPQPHRLKVFSQLEGKNIAVVLEDADLDDAATHIVAGALAYNGQRCTAIKLVAAHASIADALVAKVVERVDAMPRGLPWAEATQITPLPEPTKPAYLTELIADAVAQGASVMNRDGGRLAGALFHPAVVYPVAPAARLFNEEQFGPVVPVATFDDVSEVADTLTQSWNGQQAAIFTTSADEAATLVDVLSSVVGRININQPCKRGPDAFPFSGRRSSAMGTMSSMEALKAFSIETLVATKPTQIHLATAIEEASTFLKPLR